MDVLLPRQSVEFLTHLAQTLHKSIIFAEIAQDTINIGFGIFNHAAQKLGKASLLIYNFLHLFLRDRYWVQGYGSVDVAWVAPNLIHFDHKAERTACFYRVDFHSVLV